MSLAFPERPTKEECDAHECAATLAGRSSGPSHPIAKWKREATNVLLDAMSGLSIGQARSLLDAASKRLDEEARKVANASKVGKLSRPWPTVSIGSYVIGTDVASQ